MEEIIQKSAQLKSVILVLVFISIFLVSVFAINESLNQINSSLQDGVLNVTPDLNITFDINISINISIETNITDSLLKINLTNDFEQINGSATNVIVPSESIINSIPLPENVIIPQNITSLWNVSISKPLINQTLNDILLELRLNKNYLISEDLDFLSKIVEIRNKVNNAKANIIEKEIELNNLLKSSPEDIDNINRKSSEIKRLNSYMRDYNFRLEHLEEKLIFYEDLR